MSKLTTCISFLWRLQNIYFKCYYSRHWNFKTRELRFCVDLSWSATSFLWTTPDLTPSYFWNCWSRAESCNYSEHLLEILDFITMSKLVWLTLTLEYCSRYHSRLRPLVWWSLSHHDILQSWLRLRNCRCPHSTWKPCQGKLKECNWVSDWPPFEGRTSGGHTRWLACLASSVFHEFWPQHDTTLGGSGM